MTTPVAATLEAQAHLLRQAGCVFADRIPYPALVCDLSGSVLLANAAFEDFTGRSRADLLGADLSRCEALGEDRVRSWLSEIRNRPGPWAEEFESPTPEGPVRATARIVPLRWGTTAPFAAAILMETKTRARPGFQFRLSDACSAVARYASRVSHDMRNPVAAISTGLQYLARLLKEDPRHREALRMILEEVKNLDETILRLTSFREQITMETGSFDLGDSVVEAIAAHSDTIARKRLAVSVEQDLSLPPWTGDRERMVCAFAAVLERVLSACPDRGAVRVHLRLQSFDLPAGRLTPPGECLVVRVEAPTEDADPRAYLEALDPSSPGWSNQAGLYLAAQIIEAHHGVIEFSGVAGRQMTVSILLPADCDSEGEA